MTVEKRINRLRPVCVDEERLLASEAVALAELIVRVWLGSVLFEFEQLNKSEPSARRGATQEEIARALETGPGPEGCLEALGPATQLQLAELNEALSSSRPAARLAEWLLRWTQEERVFGEGSFRL